LAQQKQNPELLRPALAGEVGTWELFPGTYVIGIRDMDRYIQVPGEKLAPLMSALGQMDGRHTLAEISVALGASGWSMDMEALYNKVASAGLVEGIPFRGEMTRLALKLAELRIEPLFRRAGWIRRLYSFAVWLPAIAVAGALFTIFYFGTHAPLLAWRTIFWRPVGTGQWMAVVAAVILSILFHEGAHAITAVRYGLIPSRIRVLAYLAVAPYFLLSIPGLYTVPPRTRLKVWSAGPLGSLTVACMAQIGVAFVGETSFAYRWLATLAGANLMIAAWNLFPLLPTDGYFILCTLLRTHNLRLHGWRAIIDVFRRQRRPTLAMVIYGICMVGCLVLFWQRNVFRILHFFSYSIIGYALVVTLTLLLIMRQFMLASGRKSFTGLEKRKRP
jgi:putative peptide zinc metalloprotease protein